MKFVLVCVAEEGETAHVTHVQDSGGYGNLMGNGDTMEIDFNIGDSIDICHEGEDKVIADG